MQTIPPDFDLEAMKAKPKPSLDMDILVTATRPREPITDLREPSLPRLCRNDTNEHMNAESVSRARRLPCASPHSYELGQLTVDSSRIRRNRLSVGGTQGDPTSGVTSLRLTLHTR